jgi:hypothetical protein
MIAGFHEIFSGFELRELVKNGQHFKDDLCPYHQDLLLILWTDGP